MEAILQTRLNVSRALSHVPSLRVDDAIAYSPVQMLSGNGDFLFRSDIFTGLETIRFVKECIYIVNSSMLTTTSVGSRLPNARPCVV